MTGTERSRILVVDDEEARGVGWIAEQVAGDGCDGGAGAVHEGFGLQEERVR